MKAAGLAIIVGGMTARIYFTLAESIDLVADLTGQTFDIQTIRRWRRVGRHGERLLAVKIGGQWSTTQAWLCDFFLKASIAGDDEETAAKLEKLRGEVAGRPMDSRAASIAEKFGI